MDTLINILCILLTLIPLMILYAIMAAAGEGRQYNPMTPDEEKEWLMNDHGLSEEEADEICNMPRYRP